MADKRRSYVRSTVTRFPRSLPLSFPSPVTLSPPFHPVPYALSLRV